MPQNPIVHGPKLNIPQNIGGGSYYDPGTTTPTVQNELYYTEHIFGYPLSPSLFESVGVSNSVTSGNLFQINEIIQYMTQSALYTNSSNSSNLQSYSEIINMSSIMFGRNNTITNANFQSNAEVLPHFTEIVENNNSWTYNNFQSYTKTDISINPFNMGQSVTVTNT